MRTWSQYQRLLLSRATLQRVLTEAELQRLRDHLPDTYALPSVLVAGGGRASRGSEAIFLDDPSKTGWHVFADVNPSRNPHIVTDLGAPWPFRDETFDLVLSTWVLEHIATPEVYVQQAYRALRRGGAFICAVPFITWKHGSPYDYCRFTDEALSRLARAAGFKEIDIRAVGGTPLICCVSLLWPLFRVPLSGLLAFLAASAVDRLLLYASRLIGKGTLVKDSYPLSYVCLFGKPGDGSTRR